MAVINQAVARRGTARIPILVKLPQLQIGLLAVVNGAIPKSVALNGPLERNGGNPGPFKQRAVVPEVIAAPDGIHAVLLAGGHRLAVDNDIGAIAKLHDVRVVLGIRRIDETGYVGVVPNVRHPIFINGAAHWY